ncbi:MAG: aldehyde ferredoxin oxidoreductase family protein [Anaerolineae bacterium]
MPHGWCGQILSVDLTSGEVKPQALPPETYVQTIGGIGLAARLIFDNVPPQADPLGPGNVMVVAAGPLGGTTWAGSGRVELAARSPLTGLWGEASLGGYFGTHLKRAGYDAIILYGAALEPVVLVIDEGDAHLEPAGELWGKETYATEQALKERYPGSEVITIGPAGERLVPMASLVHNEGNDVAARCGLGAVAGSKRVKALVARGTQPVSVADEATFRVLKRDSLSLFQANDFLSTIRRGGGTASATPMAIDMGDLPVRNWAQGPWEWEDEARSITGQAMHELWPPKQDTCYACPIACKWTVNAPRLEGGEGHLAGPEYESLAGLGAQTQVSDPLAIIQAADLCNRSGIDTISAGATIAWAIEAFEKGILTERQSDRLSLEWGAPDLVIELLRRMGENRPGIGALLAQGSRRAAEQIGGGQEFALHVKGLELPFHHPRALRGLEIAYATLPRGASHNEEGVVFERDDTTYEAWVEAIIQSMDLSGANSSMVYCQFLAGALDEDYTACLLTAVTGVVYTPADLRRVGERTWYLRRAFNLRLGVGLEADSLPERVVKQIQAGHATLSDFDRALREFHRQRELDERGVPAARRLASLGLDNLIELLDAR